jgi:uncharacterized protein
MGRNQGAILMETTRARFSPTVHAADGATPQRVKFKGYASVFDTLIDAYVPTIIDRGAFTKTLKENATRIKVLWQHNSDWPIGVPEVLREDARGLYMEAALSSSDRAKEAAQLLRDGVITEMSIGFDPINSYMDTSGSEPVRHISELRLWEVSLVTFAANKEAKVIDVHSRRLSSAEQLAALERMLGDFDRRQAHRREAQIRELELALLDVHVRRVSR